MLIVTINNYIKYCGKGDFPKLTKYLNNYFFTGTRRSCLKKSKIITLCRKKTWKSYAK